MGQPEDVETCNAPIYSDQGFRGQCAHTLVYYSFLEKWGVVLDKNDVVIAKYYNVSP
jgi:hypothetical protein